MSHKYLLQKGAYLIIIVLKRTTILDYNLLKTFAKVSELGSFTKAAKVLNQPKSRVSRAIARLEEEVGVELIRRTTRRTSLTNVGQELYEGITPHLNGIRDELIRVGEKQEEMVGTIRITTADSFAQYILPQIICEYNSKYPKVKVEVVITNQYLDLVEENIDLAFRAGKLQSSSLIQKKFMATSFILVCSRAYINKYSSPSSIEDLKNHRFLSFKPIEKTFIDRGINLEASVTTDSFPMLLKMALEGSGITILPNFLCEKHLVSNELVRVIPSWEIQSSNHHILYPPTKNLSKKVREFINLSRQLYL